MLRKIVVGSLGALVAYGLVRWQMARWFTEEPAYTVEEHRGPLEVRRYPAAVRAETIVEAPSWREAVSTGFRRLAGYIFGQNGPAERIAMTTPVTQHAEPERIAMTAPVTQAPAGPGRWTVTFTMPRDRSLASLPRPSDDRVRLREVDSRRVAVLRFSGRYDGQRIAEKERELREALREAGLTPQGDLEWAGYDPPTTLPILRRNEIWAEL